MLERNDDPPRWAFWLAIGLIAAIAAASAALALTGFLYLIGVLT